MKSNKVENFKQKFLLTCVNHVPFDGWTVKSINLSLKELNFSKQEFKNHFPKGIRDLVKYYLEDSDNKMVLKYKKNKNTNSPIHLKIKEMILIKLQQSQNQKDVVRKTLFWLGLPKNSKIALMSLYNTVDLIWREAGDRSTDFNFYSKRAILSSVYSSTLLAFLGDNNPDLDKTEKFLDRRLKDVSKIPKLITPVKNFSNVFFNLAKGFNNKYARD